MSDVDSADSSSAASSQDSLLPNDDPNRVQIQKVDKDLKISMEKKDVDPNENFDTKPIEKSFLELHGVEDVNKAIEIETQKMFSQM